MRGKANKTIRALASSSNFCTFSEIYNINVPTISCIGTIHDFRRPNDLKKTESTIGDHSSLREYG